MTPTEPNDAFDDAEPPPRKITVLGREITMPRSRRTRIALGVALTIGGLLGFLPILGFWMIPLGILVLSYEFAMVRRYRRRGSVWWGRRKQRRETARQQANVDGG